MIRSHVTSQYYLQQFAGAVDGKKKPQLWVYEKNKETRMGTAMSEGAECGYFAYTREDGSEDESLEGVVQKLEAAADDPIRLMQYRFYGWTAEHRKAIANYAALMFSRATAKRDGSSRIFLRTQKEVAQAFEKEEFASAMARHFNVSVEEVRKHAGDALAGVATQAGIKNAFLEDLLDNVRYLAGLLFDKPWQILIAPEGYEFVTSDNHVVSTLPLNGHFVPGFGLGRQDVVVFLPINPICCLAMGPIGPERLIVFPQILQEINWAVISSARRFVYSRNKSEKTESLVNEISGTYKYGETAFLPTGGWPSVGSFFVTNSALIPPANDKITSILQSEIIMLRKKVPMSLKVKNASEFHTLLFALTGELVDANNHFSLFQALSDCYEEYFIEFSQSNTFWSLTRQALIDATLMRLGKAFDLHRNSLNLRTLVYTVKSNLNLFEEVGFRERLKGNLFVDSLASVCRVPDPATIQRDLDFLSPNNPLIEKLTVWRNKHIAHFDPLPVLSPKELTQRYPLRFTEIEELLKQGLRVVNEYSSLFIATTHSSGIVGHDDYLSILKAVRESVNRYEAAIAKEWQMLGAPPF